MENYLKEFLLQTDEMRLEITSASPIFPFSFSPFIHPGKSQDGPGWKELSELRQRQAQMQTRLPARLPAPKLLSLAHVISLEQSGEEGRGEETEVDGWRPGAGGPGC